MCDHAGVEVRLELLSPPHAPALLAFELGNRAFFAAHVGDRGDDYFRDFDERLATLVAEHEAGTSLIFLLLDPSGRVVGRVNLADVDRPEETELGFRVAEDRQAAGIATRGVGLALERARGVGVARVRARATVDNLGSQRVLARCGFEPTGPVAAPPGSAESFIGFVANLRG